DIAGAMACEPLRYCLDRRRPKKHADLHRIDRKIGEDRVHLGGDETGRHVIDRGNALRVLRGQRGDDGRTIDAERGEGLQVRLDAGATARIRACDGDGNRGHDRPRRSSAPSTTARRSCAAFAGSPASESAEMTATPSAPAAITSAVLPALMPEMAQIGNWALRASTS